MSGTYDFYFGQPWWLLACALIVPIVWLARRSLTGLGKTRRILAIALRVLVDATPRVHVIVDAIPLDDRVGRIESHAVVVVAVERVHRTPRRLRLHPPRAYK